MTFRIAWLFVAAAFCLPGTAHAQVPPLISYQGTLVENAFPASGTFTVAFRFYDTPTDGSPPPNRVKFAGRGGFPSS